MAGKAGKSGGARAGAGRPKRPTVKNTLDDPLEVLRMHWKGEIELSVTQVRAASAALPFVHKKVGEAGKKEEQGEAAKKAAVGSFAPSAPPLRLVAGKR